jgi:hypothetical protein
MVGPILGSSGDFDATPESKSLLTLLGAAV